MFYGWWKKKKDFENFEAFFWPLPQTSSDTYHTIALGGSRSLCVSLYLFLSGHNRGSLTSKSNARHDSLPAQRLLTSVCVLFNNSLNHHSTPSLLRNVTQLLTEVTQAPPTSHPFYRERKSATARPTGALGDMSPVSSSNSCSLFISYSLDLLLAHCLSNN